jgi:hypothetical protein
MDRNSAIFWVIYMSGSLFANIYVYFAWQGKEDVSQKDQTSISIILSVVVAIGTCILFFLKPVPDPEVWYIIFIILINYTV